MHSMSQREIKVFADKLGLEVQTAAPGDGMRRYTFFLNDVEMFTARGSREAEVYLTGWEAAARAVLGVR